MNSEKQKSKKEENLFLFLFTAHENWKLIFLILVSSLLLQRTKLKIYFLIVVHLQGATETTAKKLLQLLLHKKPNETTTITQGATETTY